MKLLIYTGLTCILLVCAAYTGLCISNAHNCITYHTKVSDKKTLAPEKVALKFIKWYCKNQHDIRHRHPFYNIDTTGDTTKMYSINMRNVLMYSNELRKTRWVSERFLNNIQKKYINASYYLQLHPQFDGPVVDFQKTFTIDYDFDPVLELMEEEMLTDFLNKLQVRKISIQSNKSVVVLRASSYLSYVVTLHKYKDEWLIDSIMAT